MEDVDSQGRAGSSLSAGGRLRAAREAAGLSLSDIASQTKVAERHLLAIEEDRFNDLAARTYAVGFSRAFARAVGVDEADIAEQVREQLDVEADRHARQVEPSFEPGDPARIPPVRLAWVAAAGVVIVVGLLLAFWGSFLSPEGKLPDLIAEKPAVQKSVAPRPAQTPSQVAASDGPVVLTATSDSVWVKVTDAGGKQLFQKELALGESWTVPQDAEGPQLRTGRPDALQITVGGRQVPPLADRPVTMSGISLVAADVLARGAVTQSPPPPQPAQTPRRPAVEPARPVEPSARSSAPAPGASAPVASPRPIATTPPAPRPTAARRTGSTESPSPSPIARRTAPAEVVPTAETPPTPSPTPSPKPSLQPVSTVSE
jgi:cytoskeletal protein RodZ